MWMLLTLFYALIKGSREIFKKKALEKNSVIEVLLIYTFLSLVFCIPEVHSAGGLNSVQYALVALKAFVIFVAWICSFKAIKQLPISLYGLLDLSRVVFATLLGIIVLNEKITVNKGIGLVFVCCGLLFLKFNPFKKAEKTVMTETLPEVQNDEKKALRFTDRTSWFVFLAFLSCILNAVSGLLDKILMKDLNSNQLQFWYTLFMVIYYLIYACIKKARISKSVWKNIWIYLLAAGLVVMDKALFIANGYPESQVTIMTLIKQSSVIVALMAGKFIFHEKNMLHKFICSAIILTGIILGIL